MTRKEQMDAIVARVAEDQRAAFVAEMREADTKEAREEVLKKYGVEISKEEWETLKGKAGGEVSDEELDKAAGGCCIHLTCRPW